MVNGDLARHSNLWTWAIELKRLTISLYFMLRIMIAKTAAAIAPTTIKITNTTHSKDDCKFKSSG
ncbi:hypothetical protein A3SK_0109585 [Pseudomonas amygdali pv. tabaci str. 6605]|nr:hypothetical protein A3SK_0109585 [Pseudomonas amygdali pv. tabaci str. 6605]KIY19320.1 hypothetical protein RD00_07205 [Pseudomonas amygdali pv. tabaci]BCS46583.1 hypothetical protein Pta6605_49140 [Pseudomonas amygdali pv. tabaci]